MGTRGSSIFENVGILCRQSVGQGRRRWEMFARPWVTFVDHFGGSPLAQCRCRGRLGDIVPSQTLPLATIPQCGRKSRDLVIDVPISAAGWSQSSSGCQWLWIARDLVPLESWGLGQEAYKAPSFLSKEDLQSLTSPPKDPVKCMYAHAPQSALSIPSALYSISFSRWRRKHLHQETRVLSKLGLNTPTFT